MRLPNNPAFWSTKSLITDLKLVTVCEEAQCPNRWECWGQGIATFMIAGDKCTRACGFCAVKTARPDALESDEPARIAEATRRMNLRHIVITAVARDDLRDGGAEHFRETIRAVREINPEIIIEVLVPDFNDRDSASSTGDGRTPTHLQSQPGDCGKAHSFGPLSREVSALSHRAEKGQGNGEWKCRH